MSDEQPIDDRLVDELLGAYALDAVDEEERRAIEAYLETNPRARAEVAELREVASMLAVDGEPPPEGLWDRIASGLEEPAPRPGPQLARVMPRTRSSRRRSAIAAGVGALVAAAAAVAITVVVVRDDDPRDPVVAAYEAALDDPAGRRTELRSEDETLSADAVVMPSGVGYLSASRLPELPGDETYQLWGVYADEDVISLGVIGNRPEVEPFTAADELVALVITREEAGGVVSSTSGALLVGELA